MTMMKCGHAANGTDADGHPVCVICYGMKPEATEIAIPPDLTNRMAKCTYCGKLTSSNTKLPFFEYRPTSAYDGYYDGCRGWD